MQLRLIDSLRARVRTDVRNHIASNPTLKSSRYPFIDRLVRLSFNWASFWKCIAAYGFVATIVTVAERVNEVFCASGGCPYVMPQIFEQTAYRQNLIQEVTSYMIGAQVGVLGLLSIAVSLVTLIGQRQHSNVEVRVYYSESLAAPVTASSLSLLLVMCCQLVWPADAMAHQLGFTRDTISAVVGLSAIHIIWLALNLIGLAHFVAVSLTFGQSDARKVFRERYTANKLVRPQIADALLLHGYLASAQMMKLANDKVAPVYFGTSFSGLGQSEIQTTFHKPVVLRDIWLGPLGWALRRWQARVAVEHGKSGTSQSTDAFLAFAPRPGMEHSGKTAWCHRKGSVSLSAFERWVVRLSFRFRRAK